jgi:hypothetical protein
MERKENRPRNEQKKNINGREPKIQQIDEY